MRLETESLCLPTFNDVLSAFCRAWQKFTERYQGPENLISDELPDWKFMRRHAMSRGLNDC